MNLSQATKYSPQDLEVLDGYPERMKKKSQIPGAPSVIHVLAKFGYELVQDFMEGIYQFQDKNANTVAVVHRSTQATRDRLPWQVSFFWPSKSGGVPEPVGHTNSQDLRGVMAALAEDGVVYPSTMLGASLSAKNRFKGAFIESLTIQDIRRGEDPEYIHRAEHKAALQTPKLNRTYASTAEYLVPSEHYAKNNIVYYPKILFKDFVVLAKDRDISVEDAIRYSIEAADIHVMCQCKSWSFHGFQYMARQLDYLYGLPDHKAQRFPVIRNPQLKSTACKHISKVLDQIQKDEELLVRKFSQFYGRTNFGRVTAPALEEKSRRPSLGERAGWNKLGEV